MFFNSFDKCLNSKIVWHPFRSSKLFHTFTPRFENVTIQNLLERDWKMFSVCGDLNINLLKPHKHNLTTELINSHVQ